MNERVLVGGTNPLSTFTQSILSSKYNKYISILLTSVSLFLWSISLAQAKNVEIGEYGLYSVLPWTYYGAVFLLLISMFYTLFTQRKGDPRSYKYILILQSLVLMVFLFFTPALIEGVARSPHSWSKYGYVDYIVRNGHINQTITHYHNWPVPFIFSAEMVQITSISPTAFPLIFPLILDVMLFFVVIMLFMKLFKDVKTQFLGVIIFYLITWENQFHFAPQLFALFLFLLVVYLIVFHLKRDNLRYLFLTGILLIALILTHLLTAFVTCLFLGLYILYLVFWPRADGMGGKRTKRKRRRRLGRKIRWSIKYIKFRLSSTSKRKLIIFSAIAIGGLMIWYFFAGEWVRGVGWRVDLKMFPSLFAAYFDKLNTGSDAHGNLVFIRMAFTVVVSLLAIIGAKIAFDKGHTRTMFMLIAASIVPIFLFYYGVEIVQRAYLFSTLPIAVLICSGLNRKRFLAIVLVLSFIAVPAHIMAHYGNEMIDYTPPSEISSTVLFFENTNSGTVIYGTNVLRSQYIEDYFTISIEYYVRNQETSMDTYLFYTSSGNNFSLWYFGDESSILAVDRMIQNNNYDKILHSPDCIIYKLNK